VTTATLTFIGAGNMATSIIGGLIEQGYHAQAITACDPNADTLAKLQQQFAVNISQNNTEAVNNADVVVLAVKPQILKVVAQALQKALAPNTLVISVAAGISSQHLSQWLGERVAIVRCMPNTPSLVQQGACGLFANPYTTATQRDLAQQLMDAVGYSTWIEEESQIDTVTAVSGSGPAYFFMLMEAMIDAAVTQGLSKEAATQLTLQTALGAATLAKGSDVDVAELRQRVTSPGGTTASALASFNEDDFHTIVAKAMAACTERSQAMAQEFS